MFTDLSYKRNCSFKFTLKSSFTTMFGAAPDLDNSDMIGDTLADLMDLSEELLENVALLGLVTTTDN